MKHALARTKRECITREMMSREESDLLREELSHARKALDVSREQLERTYERIAEDRRLAEDRRDLQQLEEQNRQQMQRAERGKIDRLMVELQEKDSRLRSLTSKVEKHQVVGRMNRTRIHRNLHEMENKLVIERKVKVEALERVDDLQSVIMNSSEHTNTTELKRPKSSAIKLSKTVTRIRPMTSSANKLRMNNYVPAPLPKKRPHTAAGNVLRDRIAASVLFPDDGGDHHHNQYPDLLPESRRVF